MNRATWEEMRAGRAARVDEIGVHYLDQWGERVYAPRDTPATNGTARRSAGGEPHEHESRPVLVRLSDVTPERVRWLWRGRLPRGKLVVLDGDPDKGKSTMAVDLAARISTASPMPDGERLERPEAVVVMSAEDGLADTIRPRLDAAGADTSRVVAFTEVRLPDGTARLPSLPADLDLLEGVVAKEGAALVVVDVLNAYLGAAVDSYRDQDVRRALHPLAAMAERTGATVLCLRHLTKGSGGANALYRGTGSIGIVGAARVGLVAAVDPDDESRRILAVGKCNLAAKEPALIYRLVPDEERAVARVCWEGVSHHTADRLLVTRDERDEDAGPRDEAIAFLSDLLATGAVPAKVGKLEAAEAGIASRTLDRAKKSLGVRSVKLGKPGEPGQWMWTLDERRTPREDEERHTPGMALFGERGDLRGAQQAAEASIASALGES